MKVTKQDLINLIKEELDDLLGELDRSGHTGTAGTGLSNPIGGHWVRNPMIILPTGTGEKLYTRSPIGAPGEIGSHDPKKLKNPKVFDAHDWKFKDPGKASKYTAMQETLLQELEALLNKGK